MRYDSLKDLLGEGFFAFLRKWRQRTPLSDQENPDFIWALKNVSFQVNQGEIVGLIGRNGAGKSTLLKILSRITEPTLGEACIHGRLSSLLEVGTGFHPELTGRENIYLNGVILGMKKHEIKKKFDEIVSFAEIGKFLDTPVKRYSSGMYVKLAFSVAAHLEPEILLVDEVLAVGDAAFQKKCLGKLQDVAGHGRTVLFVSHNMAAVKRLCQRVIVFKDGEIEADASPAEAIKLYLSEQRTESYGKCFFHGDHLPGDDSVRLLSVQLLNSSGVPSASFDIDQSFVIEVCFKVLHEIENFHLYIRITTGDGIIAFGSGDWDVGLHEKYAEGYGPGMYRSLCKVPGHLLNRGDFNLSVFGQIPLDKYHFYEESVLKFRISEMGGVGGPDSLLRPGIFRPKLNWEIHQGCQTGTENGC